MNKASLIAISRLRIGTDGHGVTTLVAFHGCPLHCHYCLNPECLEPTAKVLEMSPEEVMAEVSKDELYYIATKGGVTFGGGEPLLHSQFIKDVLELGASRWHTTVETSLNVPRSHLEELFPFIDEYIVDIKDMDSEVYESYTGRSNELVISNLRWLVEKGLAKRILCRVPLIPGYNDLESQRESQHKLLQMGLERSELFTYKTEGL